jgi:hypothetical protein
MLRARINFYQVQQLILAFDTTDMPTAHHCKQWTKPPLSTHYEADDRTL